MREEILIQLEAAYARQRIENERTEKARRERIKTAYPEIEGLIREREELIFGTISRILDGSAKADNLPEKTEALNRRIRAELKKKGLPEDYLAPVCRCSACRDTGYCGELIKNPCECLIRAYQQKIREEIGLNAEKAETFETFDLTIIPDRVAEGQTLTQRELSKKALMFCKKWTKNYPQAPSRDILLTGKSGLGKTFLMRAMANALIERDINVLMVSAYNLLQTARKYYFEDDTAFEEVLKIPVLLIDDLGSEPMLNNVTVEMLFNLLNERQNRSLSTIVSTNLNLQEFRERYTERIASRLCNVESMILTLAGTDLRKLERGQ